MLKQSCQPTGRWFGLMLPVPHAENVTMGQDAQNHSFMASSPSSTGLPKREKGSGGEMPSSSLLPLIWMAFVAISKWQKLSETCYNIGRGWEDNRTQGVWSSLWGSAGPRRLVPWFGIKTLPVAAEGPRGKRDGCHPEGGLSGAHLMCFISEPFGSSLRKHLGMQGNTVPGRRVGKKVALWPCLEGLSQSQAHRKLVQIFCLSPARLWLPGCWRWPPESLGKSSPSKFLLAVWNRILKCLFAEICCGQFTVIWNGNTGKRDIFQGMEMQFDS